MRIALISNMFPPDSDGGLEVNALKVANGLRGRGHQVEVLTSRYRPGFVPNEPPPEWVHRVLRLAPPWSSEWTGLAGKPKLLKALIGEVSALRHNVRATDRWLTGREFDIAYCFGMSLIGPATTLPFTRRGIPAFFHQGGGYLEARYVRAPKESVFLRARRALLKMEEQVDLRYLGYVSRFLIEQGEAAGFFEAPNRGTGVRAIIPRGIEFAPRTDVERQRVVPPRLLMAGRISPIKGFHRAIEALGKLARRRPELPWSLAIAGGADNLDLVAQSGDAYLRDLHRQIQNEGMEDRVTFLGRLSRAELLEAMASSTAFISASTFGEPFANTIIEALGSGTPLIVSADGSSREVVVHEESALVFDKEDSDELAHCIERVLDDPPFGWRLAARGVQVILENYTIERILDRTEAILTEVIEHAQQERMSTGG
ncbi:MAG: glycosyltransferase family 4 protein [Fimbriimonadaceae bacterium]|nr:glycosyltransferase family 4 protein [Chthonomonadaceae bacterium]MCO5297683.1 glycosyltransferase family 4 protein [Fimbriimonadaceae bacterium]